MSDAVREQVVELAKLGLPQDQIARLVKISESSLKKYYADELKLGLAESNKELSGWAFKSAREGNPTMIIFLCKVRLGWKEKADGEQPKQEPTKIVVEVQAPPEEPKK